MIKMAYNVPDVKHMGDVDSDCRRLESHGANILKRNISWGEEEISEATIYFECKESEITEFEDLGAWKV